MHKNKMTFRGSRFTDKLLLTYIRKIPNHPFKIRIVNRLNDIFFNNSVKVKCENDAVFSFSSREQMGHGILKTNEYEPLTFDVCRDVLKSGGVLVDIGANIGLFSIYLSTLKDVKVYVIEPAAQNFQKFLENINRNNCKNITPINIGLSYQDSFGYMINLSPKNSGTIKVVDDKDETSSYMIRLCTLAELVNHLEIKEIQLLKIDVEGFEMNVFKGFFTKDNAVMPKNIIMEFGDQIERTGYDLQESFNYFIAMGYQAFDVTGKPCKFDDDLPEGNLWLRYEK